MMRAPDTNPFIAPASPQNAVLASDIAVRVAGRAAAYRWYIASSLLTATIWSFGQNIVFPFRGGHGFEQGWTGFWLSLLFLTVVCVVNSIGFLMAMMIAPPITVSTARRYNSVCFSLGVLNLVGFGLTIFISDFTRLIPELFLFVASTVGQSFVVSLGILLCCLQFGFIRSKYVNDGLA